MTVLIAARSRPLEGGPSFSLANRLARAVWICTWTLLAAWTPPPLHGWRRAILRLFGARIGRGARVYASVRIWYPPRLRMGDFAVLGPRVICYNQDRIEIGARAIVSQGAHLCTGSHDLGDPNFQLVTRPIVIGEDAWIAAEAFIGPGVTVGRGAVLGARGVTFRALQPGRVYAGNPARDIRARAAESAGAS